VRHCGRRESARVSRRKTGKDGFSARDRDKADRAAGQFLPADVIGRDDYETGDEAELLSKAGRNPCFLYLFP